MNGFSKRWAILQNHTNKRVLEGSFRFWVYSVLGFVLERVINGIAYGTWLDNSVLLGPYQPMYAVGMMAADSAVRQLTHGHTRWMYQVGLVYTVTAVSEWLSGQGYFYLTGRHLWDYRSTFAVCTGPYTCVVPTFLFALAALGFAYGLAPRLRRWTVTVPLGLKVCVLSLFVMDVIVTYGRLYAAR